MLCEFKFPDVGEGIAEGEIVRWLVKEGDSVKEDQDLLEVETDKALLTLNSPYTGKVTQLHGKEGEIIKVDDVLTTIEAGGEQATALEAEKKDSGTVVGTLGDNEVVEVVRPVQATPAVRALAKQMQIDLASVKWTGPGGRITIEDVGIAVDTPDGLIVFVIKDADRKNILDLAKETATLAEKARHRKIDLHELKGSTFTITNYGVVGASYGTPIINYPEVAILGLGKIEDRPVVRSGQIAIRKMMPLSLAFDHRVIDGVEAGRFLGVVIQHLEDPNLMLIEGK